LHLFQGAPKKTLLVTTAFALLLTGCKGGSSPEARLQELRSPFGADSVLTAKAEITADYGERVYEYTVTIEGTQKAGKLTVEKPENIAGTVLGWSDGSTTLTSEDVTLETGPLTESGLSPADAVPLLLSACAEGTLIEYQSPGDDGLLYAQLEVPEQPTQTVSCWFEEQSGAVKRCTLAEQGVTVLTLDFSNFKLTPPPAEGEKP
jgi:hypothetical protein